MDKRNDKENIKLKLNKKKLCKKTKNNSPNKTNKKSDKKKTKKITQKTILKYSKLISLNKELHGGFKIGEGGFGCVISPYIPCSKELPTSQIYISKIIQSNFRDYREEVKLLKKIKKIDPNNKHLIY